MQYLAFYLLLINFAAFAACWADKRRARKHRWRIRERTLFGLAIAGGAVGLLMGMKTFRHKTQHKSFTIGVPFILLCQIALALYVVYRIEGI